MKSLRDTWADTTTLHGRLLIIVLGGLAEDERELTRNYTSEGGERAKVKGDGPQAEIDAPSAPGAVARRDAVEALVDIARPYNGSHRTMSGL